MRVLIISVQKGLETRTVRFRNPPTHWDLNRKIRNIKAAREIQKIQKETKAEKVDKDLKAPRVRTIWFVMISRDVLYTAGIVQPGKNFSWSSRPLLSKANFLYRYQAGSRQTTVHLNVFWIQNYTLTDFFYCDSAPTISPQNKAHKANDTSSCLIEWFDDMIHINSAWFHLVLIFLKECWFSPNCDRSTDRPIDRPFCVEMQEFIWSYVLALLWSVMAFPGCALIFSILTHAWPTDRPMGWPMDGQTWF